VRESGCSLLVVEQHLDHALGLADHAVVLTQGEVSFAGEPDELARRSDTLLHAVSTQPIDHDGVGT